MLLPMWFVALHGGQPPEGIAIDPTVSDIRPLGGFVDTPNKLSPGQMGVTSGPPPSGLVGVRRRAPVRERGRPAGRRRPRPPRGGAVGGRWLTTPTRWVVEYHPANEGVEGIATMGALTVLAIAFGALFAAVSPTLARTQYFGGTRRASSARSPPSPSPFTPGACRTSSSRRRGR